MNLKPLLLLSSTALAVVTSTVSAQPFNSFDPRSMAMGGTGVAIADPATAPFFNPAMLAAGRDEQGFSLEIPIVGVRAHDPEEMIDTVDELTNVSLPALDQAVLTYNGTAFPNSTNLRNVSSALTAVNNDMLAVSQEKLQVELGAAIVIGIPSEKLGMAVTASSWNVVGANLVYTDNALVTNVTTELNDCADFIDGLGGLCGGTYTSGTGDNIGFDPNNIASGLQSEVNARGVQLNEVGISLARNFNILGITDLAIGITPKMVKATVYDYTENINIADAADFNDAKKEYSNFNMDVGVAKELATGFSIGFVAKNIKSEDYDTLAGNTVSTKPQLRAGISYQTDSTLFAIDMDLSENEAVSYEDDSRQIAAGVELNIINSLKLRAGYRGDTVNNDRGVLSAGVGFNFFGAHIDLAGAKSDSEVGASFQLGLAF